MNVKPHSYFFNGNDSDWQKIDGDEPIFWNGKTKELIVVGQDYCMSCQMPSSREMKL